MEGKVYIDNLIEKLRENNYKRNYINACVNYASRLIENNMPVIFDTKHLSLLLGVDGEELAKHLVCEECFYNKKEIPKKNKGTRVLYIPSVSMKYIQRWILDNILYRIPVSSASTGFRRKQSILSNAIAHTNKVCVINLDIKDFFPSIDIDRVFRVFNYYGYTREVSFVLAKLCTYGDYLPQGSPASPYLSNIICLKMDKRLQMLANKYKASYTRYADDITFSASYGIGKCVDIITHIVKDEGFYINPLKTRIAYKYQRQCVTGLIVNNQTIKINRQYKRQVNQEIYYCLKFGISSHLKHIKCDKSFYKEHLYGKVYFIKMVEPEVGNHLLNKLNEIKWEY
jgi:RNA-directed DNA polymerase